MERRKAIKNIGGAFGFAIATPTVLGILNGCEPQPFAEWIPRFFEQEDGRFVARLLDVMLPETDSPKATDIRIHDVIDGYMEHVLPAEEKRVARETTAHFLSKVKELTDKEDLSKITEEEITKVLSIYLARISPELEEQQAEALSDYREAILAGGDATLEPETASFIWARAIRGMAVNAYRSAEEIGEGYLKYVSIPGRYVGCGDVNELSDGKAYALRAPKMPVKFG